MATKSLGIGLIGCGFMGRTHSNAYLRLNNFFPVEHRPVLRAICDVNLQKAQQFVDVWGYGRAETDWRRLIEAKDIDLIDICVPNFAHKEIAVAARAGRQDGPLRETAGHECRRRRGDGARGGGGRGPEHDLVQLPARAVHCAGQADHRRRAHRAALPLPRDVPAGLDHFRRRPAGRRRALAAGHQGRRQRRHGRSAGAFHRHRPCGSTAPSRAWWRRPRLSSRNASTRCSGKVEPVGIDDACMFLAEFANGSMGTFESTRYARGRKNFNTFELNGADGSVYFDLEEPEYLQFFEYKQLQSGKKVESHLTGWRKIHVTNSEHPYMSRYWVPGTCIGYEHTFLNQLADFIAGIESGTPAQPDFRNGLRTQRVCDAVLESARSSRWIEEIE